MPSKQLVRATDGAQEWIRSLDPWPEEFGLDRMRAVLAELGDPQLAYPAVHVVGTNGKTTMTRTIEALLAAAGLVVGAYTSPHVLGWGERIRVGGREADFEAAVDRVRPVCERLGATQFESLTAAALKVFADSGADAAVVEAGLGGRYDATNVLRSPVQVLTNVGLDHTEVLGQTREAIAAEKLAVVQPDATVVLPDLEFAELVRRARVVVGGAREAAEAFLGRPVEEVPEVELPGRLELRSDRPLELWDGAHNPDGVDYLVARLPARNDFVVVASILGDKDADRMLAALRAVGDVLIATESSNPRAVASRELAARAAPHFSAVEAIADPRAALGRARELAGDEGAVLATGSLYLLADLNADRAEAYHDEVW
jgi:dihydrofolate synthase / folylpolyglutamate synthase